MTLMITRRAVVDDAALVALAHVRGWQVAYRDILPESYLSSIDLAERTTMWEQFLAEDVPADYVVELDGTVIGFANVGPWRDKPEEPSLAELWAMYVNPDHWGTGAGYALMLATTEHFREASVHTGYLWVLEDNAQARAFYERQGWRADDVTKTEVLGETELTERRYSITL